MSFLKDPCLFLLASRSTYYKEPPTVLGKNIVFIFFSCHYILIYFHFDTVAQLNTILQQAWDEEQIAQTIISSLVSLYSATLF